MSSASIREAAFQRFENVPAGVVEKKATSRHRYRCAPEASNDDDELVLQSVPDKVQRCFQQRFEKSSGLPSSSSSLSDNDDDVPSQNQKTQLKSKPRSSFGCVPHRDLLTFMAIAGHISADIVGPGVYDPFTNASWGTPTHNLVYKAQQQQKHRPSTQQHHCPRTRADVDIGGLSRAEMWKVMRQGPTGGKPSQQQSAASSPSFPTHAARRSRANRAPTPCLNDQEAIANAEP